MQRFSDKIASCVSFLISMNQGSQEKKMTERRTRVVERHKRAPLVIKSMTKIVERSDGSTIRISLPWLDWMEASAEAEAKPAGRAKSAEK